MLRPDADEFVPQPGSVEVDWNSMDFQLKEESIVTRPLQSRILSEGSVSCTRKELREIVTLDILPLVDAAVQCEVYGIEFDVSLLAPARKTLRNHCVAEVLLSPPVVNAAGCSVRCDSRESMVRRVLREPCSAEPLPMVPPSGFEQNLAMVGDRCRVLLNHLGRAAKLANNARTRCAQGGRDAAVETVFEDYFDLLDPVGVEERIQHNRRVEEDAIGLEINYMGVPTCD